MKKRSIIVCKDKICYHDSNSIFLRRETSMKKITKKALSLFIAMIVLVASLCIYPTDTVQAATIPSITITRNGQNIGLVYSKWDMGDYSYTLKVKGTTVTKCVSSKPSVAKATKFKTGWGFSPRKVGATKFTLTCKNGKKYVVKLQIFKYSNPFRTIKIGSKDYASLFKSNSGMMLRMPSNTLKKGTYSFSVTTNANWKVARADVVYISRKGSGVASKSLTKAKKITIQDPKTKYNFVDFQMKYKNIPIYNSYQLGLFKF